MNWRDRCTLHQGDYRETLALADGWADLTHEVAEHVLVGVHPVVACVAKNDHVCEFQTQRRVLGPPLNVVKVETARVAHSRPSITIPAPLALVRVACESVTSKCGPLCACVHALPFWSAAAFVVVVKRATLSVHRIVRTKLATGAYASLRTLRARLVRVVPPTARIHVDGISLASNGAPFRATGNPEINKLRVDLFRVTPDQSADRVGGQAIIDVAGAEPIWIKVRRFHEVILPPHANPRNRVTYE